MIHFKESPNISAEYVMDFASSRILQVCLASESPLPHRFKLFTSSMESARARLSARASVRDTMASIPPKFTLARNTSTRLSSFVCRRHFPFAASLSEFVCRLFLFFLEAYSCFHFKPAQAHILTRCLISKCKHDPTKAPRTWRPNPRHEP